MSSGGWRGDEFSRRQNVNLPSTDELTLLLRTEALGPQGGRGAQGWRCRGGTGVLLPREPNRTVRPCRSTAGRWPHCAGRTPAAALWKPWPASAPTTHPFQYLPSQALAAGAEPPCARNSRSAALGKLQCIGGGF